MLYAYASLHLISAFFGLENRQNEEGHTACRLGTSPGSPCSWFQRFPAVTGADLYMRWWWAVRHNIVDRATFPDQPGLHSVLGCSHTQLHRLYSWSPLVQGSRSSGSLQGHFGQKARCSGPTPSFELLYWLGSSKLGGQKGAATDAGECPEWQRAGAMQPCCDSAPWSRREQAELIYTLCEVFGIYYLSIFPDIYSRELPRIYGIYYLHKEFPGACKKRQIS